MHAESTVVKTRFVDDTHTIAKDEHSDGLEVIAAGQWRCATSSLQLAFERILDPPLAPSMHGAYLLPSVENSRLLNFALEEPDREKRHKVLRGIFDGYNASSDYPGFPFTADLVDIYPNAKIVLNKRKSSDEWTRSVRTSLMFFTTYQYMLTTFWIPSSWWHWRTFRTYRRLAKQRFDVDDIFSPQCYERHNQWVRDIASARGREILEWEPSDGWEPLCRFIGREVPKEEFPRTNEAAEIEKVRMLLLEKGLWRWAQVVGLVVLMSTFGTYIWKTSIGSESGWLR